MAREVIESWRPHRRSETPQAGATGQPVRSSVRAPHNSTANIVRAMSRTAAAGVERAVEAEKVVIRPLQDSSPAAKMEPPHNSTASIVRAMSSGAPASVERAVEVEQIVIPSIAYRVPAVRIEDPVAVEPSPRVAPVMAPIAVSSKPFPEPSPVVEAAPLEEPAMLRVSPVDLPTKTTASPTWRMASNDEEVPDDVPAIRAALTPPSRIVDVPEPAFIPPRSFDLPPLDLLLTQSGIVDEASAESLEETGILIEQRLREFKVPVTVVGASAGPVITRYEVEPAIGVRGNQIVALMKDLARGLGRTSIRVVETIPGKTCMGLELPNEQRQMIGLIDIFQSDAFRDHDSPLALAMGKDITGEPVVVDLARAPHMLVAGTTGSGKSVAVNAMILSMLYRATPDEVRMIMIDPKMLELSIYEGIPHLLAPVVTDMKLAANALNWCVAEMEDRYRVMSALRVRNLAGYNEKIRDARAAGAPLYKPVTESGVAPEPLDTLPMIVVIIDELADLMMVAGKKIEELIARLAQKARAAGIHLILATQRPSVDVITGLIKANIPTRVAFQVSSKIDSRTILDQMGAESLLGAGDMLFLPPGTGYPQRVHGAFVSDEDVHRVVAHLKKYGAPDYRAEILAGSPADAVDLFGEESADAELDPLYDDAVAFVLRSRRASISSVQRQFRIGYNRAARLVESMEAAGLVSSMGHNGAREVLAPGLDDGL